MGDALAIESNDGRHVGFVLLAPSEGSDGRGNCIFRCLPKDGGFTSATATLITRLQEKGEFHFRRRIRDAQTEIEIVGQPPGGYRISLDRDGVGVMRWMKEGEKELVLANIRAASKNDS